MYTFTCNSDQPIYWQAAFLTCIGVGRFIFFNFLIVLI